MQVRRNRASNLGPGNVRTNGTRAHHGHDLSAPVGTNVSSSMAGEVVSSYNSSSYGNTVVVKTNVFMGPVQETVNPLTGATEVTEQNIYVQYSPQLPQVFRPGMCDGATCGWFAKNRL